MTRRSLLRLAATTSFVVSLFAKEKAGQNSRTSVAVRTFVGNDLEIIRNWVHAQPASALPPGLARSGSLPRGLERQLVRRGRLPPGLEKRLTPFPAELDDQLPPLREGLGRFFVEGRAVILSRNTRMIFDVFLP